MNADLLSISQFGGDATFVAEDPKTGGELTFSMVFRVETVLAAPQRGGPEESDPAVFVTLTVIDLAGFPLLVAVGDTASGVEVSPVTRGRPSGDSTRIEATVPLVDEFGVGFLATLDFTFQVSGPVIHEVFNERAVQPNGVVIATHINHDHAPATATGALTFQTDFFEGGTYRLSTTNAELVWESIQSVVVSPHGEAEGVALASAAGFDWVL